MRPLVSIALAMALLLSGELYGSTGGGKVVEVRKGGSFSRSWFGVSVKDLTEKQAKELGLPKAEGAYVDDVVKKSPAEAAGVQEGDVIVEFGGRQIYDADGLVSAVRKTEVGAKVSLTVLRKGERKNLHATIGKMPRKRMSIVFTPRDIPHLVHIEKGPSLGMRVIPLNPQLGKFFEVPDGKGLLVEEVKQGSSAEKAGFMAGDVITKIGDKRVGKVSEFRSELAEYEEGDKITVEIFRKGSRKTLTVEVEETEDEEFEFSIGRLDVPGMNIDLPEFDFKFDELRPELERLQRELDMLKERIEKGIHERLVWEERRFSES